MDVVVDSSTQATLGNLLAQVNFLTNQLYNAQFQNAEFEANNVLAYPTVCRYCNGPHMSRVCQMEDPFAQVQPPQLPQEETLSIAEMANTQAHYMANAYTKVMNERSHALQGENLSIVKMASAYTRFMDDAKKRKTSYC